MIATALRSAMARRCRRRACEPWLCPGRGVRTGDLWPFPHSGLLGHSSDFSRYVSGPPPGTRPLLSLSANKFPGPKGQPSDARMALAQGASAGVARLVRARCCGRKQETPHSPDPLPRAPTRYLVKPVAQEAVSGSGRGWISHCRFTVIMSACPKRFDAYRKGEGGASPAETLRAVCER